MVELRSRVRAPVLVAYMAFVLIGIGSGVNGVLLPAEIRDYGVDKTAIGVMFFTFSAGFVLGGGSSGALVQRCGTRIALAVGGSASVLAGLYSGTRPSLVAFIAVQVVAGYGGGVLETVLNAYLATLPSATTLLNRLHAFFGVGALLGPLLATWILGFARWPAVWLVLAAASVPLTVAFPLVYPRRAVLEPQSGAARRSSLLAPAMRRSGVLLAAVLLATYVGLEISLGNWGFSYLVEQREQNTLLAGYTVSGFWLGLTLGRFVLSPVATRLGLTPAGLIMACLGGVAGFVVLVWLVPAAAAASVGFGLLGFFLGPIFPTTVAVAPILAEPRLVPTVIGIMNAGSVIGGSALPWLAGVLAQRTGSWTLLPFALVLAGAQLVICWRMAGLLRGARG